MNSCRTLTILLLAALSSLAMVMRPGAGPVRNKYVQTVQIQHAAEPAQMRSRSLFRLPSSGMPFDVEQPGSENLGSRRPEQGQAGNSLPLLSFIGAGMAIGGLLSTRWANRGDK